MCSSAVALESDKIVMGGVGKWQTGALYFEVSRHGCSRISSLVGEDRPAGCPHPTFTPIPHKGYSVNPKVQADTDDLHGVSKLQSLTITL